MQPINKKAVQKELDIAAEELERHGYVDLANRVDQYSSLIMKANKDTDLQELRRGLERVQREASRRHEAFVKKEDSKDKMDLLQKKLAELRKEKTKKADKKQLSKAGSEKLAKLIDAARSRKVEKSKYARTEALKKQIRARKLARKREEAKE